MTTDGTDARQGLVVEPFNAVNEQNDYEVCTHTPSRHISLVSDVFVLL